MSKSPTGVILAGGASRRMGSDKSSLLIDGRPMVVRVSDALWEAGCQPVVCQGGDPEVLASLGLELIPDTNPGAGPVRAIHDALARADGWVVISACDLPDLDAESIRSVIDALDGDQGDASFASVATSDGRQHLVSCWSDTALPAVEAAIAAGAESYRELLDRVAAIAVPVNPAMMRNVNEPHDVG